MKSDKCLLFYEMGSWNVGLDAQATPSYSQHKINRFSTALERTNVADIAEI
jgi:hypothetical protein